MGTEKSVGSRTPGFREAFKSNVRKRWPIFLGLVIADYLGVIIIGGDWGVFIDYIFL
jgi:hypothetical protein